MSRLLRYTTLSVLLILALLAAADRTTAAITAEEMEQLQSAISDAEAKWMADFTSMTVLGDEAVLKMAGGLAPDVTLLPPRTRPELTVNRDIPTRFSWGDNEGMNFLSDIRNQGICGSCWAFAASASFEAKTRILLDQPGNAVNVSEQEMVSCWKLNCDGATLDWTLGRFQDDGAVDENCFSYASGNGGVPPCNSRCEQWYLRKYFLSTWGRYDSPSIDTLKNEIMGFGPVCTWMEVFGDFDAYSGGVYSHVWGDSRGGHFVVLYGWDDADSCWLARNSWGTNWGEVGPDGQRGWFRIRMGTNEVGCETWVYWLDPSSASLLTLSGSVSSATGAPINDVVIEGLPFGDPVYTDSDGRYRCLLPVHWHGHTMPMSECLDFEPAERVYNDLISDQLAEDYIADSIDLHPPSCVYCTSNGASISVSWSLTEGATSYCLYRNGQLWQCGIVDTIAAVPYDTRLSACFSVRAVYGVCGESVLSTEACCSLATETCDTLIFRKGWNFVSTSIDVSASGLPSLFGSNWSDVDIIKGKSGFCIPYGACSLVEWDPLSSYKVHVARPMVLSLCGDRTPDTTSIYLDQGWNWVSYLGNCCLDAPVAVSSLGGCFEVIKGQRGFCIRDGVNSLGFLFPGEGYAVYVACEGVLTLPECLYWSQKAVVEVPLATHDEPYYVVRDSTDEYQPVVVDLGSGFEVGDEVALFTKNGDLTGCGIYYGEPVAIQAWRDDPRTNIREGWIVDDEIEVRVYRLSVEEEQLVDYTIEVGSKVYGESPYTLLSVTSGCEEPVHPEFSLSENYPNPFNPETVISFSIEVRGQIELAVYNVLGQKVAVLIDGELGSGQHSVNWDGTLDNGKPAASGIYLYRLTTSKGSAAKKMLYLK